MEREVMLTGIGGQGVQLAAQAIARAATLEGRHAQFFGVYAGAMRGMYSDSSVVVSDSPIDAPPILPRTWAAVALHHEYWPALAPKVRDGGIVLVNSTVFEGPAFEPPRAAVLTVELPAGAVATRSGNPMGTSMAMVGALVAITGLVGIDAAVAGMVEALPPYRRQHAERNEAAIRAGAAAAPAGLAPAWEGAPA